MTDKDLEDTLRSLMQEQALAVLATQSNDHPYTNLIAFAATDDLKHILFATPIFTRKYSNLRSSQKASMMIDNRSNEISDFKEATVVNAMGQVMEVDKTPELSALYLAKHPHLEGFLESPSSALMRMEVEKYIIATSFQNVVEIDMS